MPATAVVLWSHVVGLVVLALAAPLVGGTLTTESLAIGARAGIVGAVGVALFYQALSLGSMSVVAPVAALLSAAVPVFAGLLLNGERPAVAAIAGIALALLAIALVAREDSVPAERSRRHLLPLILALAAGLGFGLFFVLLDTAGDSVGIWPLVGARIASVTLFGALGLAKITDSARPGTRPDRPSALASSTPPRTSSTSWPSATACCRWLRC